MIAVRPTDAIRRELRIGAAVCLATAIAFATIGVAWVHDLRAPRLTLLGAGREFLSALITSGGSRLLIATGDEPAELTTALEQARHPTTPRLDLALLAGNGRALFGPAAIAAGTEARHLMTIGHLPSSPEAAAIRSADPNALTTAKQIRLDGGVTVDLELTTGAGDQPETINWRAIVRRQATSVVILSHSSAAELFDEPDPVSAVVVASGGDPLAAWAAMPAPVLAFPDAAIPGAELRQAIAEAEAPRWTIRVGAGEAIPLGFGADGLELASMAAMPLASPVSARRRGRPGQPAGRGQGMMAQIQADIRASPVVHADKTGWRENGRYGYA